MSAPEPIIVAFACEYCAYTAADMAGSQQLSYPTNVKIIKVPCSGKVDVQHILRALQKGADGVLVAGCLPGDCHFKSGNQRALRRVEMVQGLLSEIGWEPQRVAMAHMSAGQGQVFAQVASEFTESIRQLGLNPLRKGSSQAA